MTINPSLFIFTTTYSPQFNYITRKYFPILSLDDTMSKMLTLPVKFVAKKAPTIGSMISPYLFPNGQHCTNT